MVGTIRGLQRRSGDRIPRDPDVHPGLDHRSACRVQARDLAAYNDELLSGLVTLRVASPDLSAWQAIVLGRSLEEAVGMEKRRPDGSREDSQLGTARAALRTGLEIWRRRGTRGQVRRDG